MSHYEKCNEDDTYVTIYTCTTCDEVLDLTIEDVFTDKHGNFHHIKCARRR